MLSVLKDINFLYGQMIYKYNIIINLYTTYKKSLKNYQLFDFAFVQYDERYYIFHQKDWFRIIVNF